MTPITHITPREQALQRENERLTDQAKRQSATIHVQAVAIQSMTEEIEGWKADKKLLDELMSVLEEQAKDEYSCETAITYMNMYVVEYIAEMPK